MKADFSFYAMNNYPRKVTANWSKDQKHLLFTFDKGNPETEYFYDVPKSELIGLKPDRVNWHRQLNGKSWYAQVKAQVEQMIKEAKK